MRWLKRKLRNWLEYNENEKFDPRVRRGRIESSGLVVCDTDVESTSIDSDPVLNFKVYSAVGGKIVEFRHYDRQKDRNHYQTYIITNEQDFGERIAKIATMESLKI